MKYVELEEQKCGSKRLNADLPRSAQNAAQNELFRDRMDLAAVIGIFAFIRSVMLRNVNKYGLV